MGCGDPTAMLFGRGDLPFGGPKNELPSWEV